MCLETHLQPCEAVLEPGLCISRALFAFYPSFSEVHQQLCTSKQELSELQKLLEEERDRRLTAENSLSLAKEQIPG